LAERILLSKEALYGERKQVTVLFADLKGSMELVADRDPEEARNLLDPVLEKMIEAVHRYEGTVNQVMGDGIMALFGAPLAVEDHAIRACYAALAMQSSIHAHNETLRRVENVPVRIRVGLNSGEVVVRSIGSDLHMDYTAVGQTTHLAARMEQLADPGTTLLTTSTLQLAEGRVATKPQGLRRIKGLAEPVEVHELTGVGAARSRLQASALRGLTKFVGRDAEMAHITGALKRVAIGHGEVVALVGEPAVGKSRLAWEAIHSHRVPGWLVLESASLSYGKATAYAPIIELLKAYFHIEERDDGRRVREKVAGKLFALDRRFEHLLSPLLFLLEVPLEDAQWLQLDPPQRRQRILDACKRVMLRQAEIQPVLLVFEDLHWVDNETQGFLDSLVESLPSARVLLLVNYRPEYQHRWGGNTYYSQLRIDPLNSESCEALLQSLLGDDTSLSPLKRLLIERTEGNPLFAEESVRTLVETGELQGERGAYRLVASTARLVIPASVQAILAARIDRLPSEDRRLLQCAAVIGKDVPYALLQAIAELPEARLRQGLADLQTGEFLYETHVLPDLEYTFKHALTHEVAYASLLHERRRTLHARIVEAIERLYPDRLVEHTERLGDHAFRGAVWEKAHVYLRQAGSKAFDRSANRQAVGCFEQALDALKHLRERSGTREQAIDLHFDLRNALLPLGEFGRLYDYLREAEMLAHALHDEPRLGSVSGYLAHYYCLTGHYQQAIESGQRGLVIAQSIGDASLQVGSTYYTGLAYYYLGNYPSAVEFQKRVMALLGNAMTSAQFPMAGLPAVFCRAILALALTDLGHFTDATAVGEESLRLSELANHPYSMVFALLAGGGVHVRKGDFGAAIPLLERALELCEQTHLAFWFPFVGSGLGSAYAWSGRILEGVPLLERAVEVATSMKLVSVRANMLTSLSEAYLLARRTAEAAEVADGALDLARAYKERGAEAWALRQIGEICSHRDLPEAEKAEDSYRRSTAIADELRMRPLQARCQLGLGEFARRRGQGSQAREHLTQAAESFREMGMQFWLEKAEAYL
jgi:class 3 adenylate cyclase/tetratricopeptide (TPR) repeat protein